MTAEQLRAALVERSPLPDHIVLDGPDELDLGGVALSAANLDRLMRVDVSAMRALRLGPGITAAHIARLCAMPGLAAIKSLTIEGGSDLEDGDDDAIDAIDAADVTDVMPATFGTAGAARVATCAALKTLHTLRLPTAWIDDAGAAALAAADWPALRVLDLAGNVIGVAGVKALLASPLAARLDEIDLSANPIGDQGLIALAQSGVLARAVVKAGQGPVSAAAGEAILAAGEVRSLSLEGAVVSPELAEKLAARFGDRVRVP